jgi:hypothetical protein
VRVNDKPLDAGKSRVAVTPMLGKTKGLAIAVDF